MWTSNIHGVTEAMFYYQMISHQLKELSTLGELLVEANKFSEGINDLVEQVDQKLYASQSAILWAEDFKVIFQENPKDIKDVNEMIRALKDKREDVKELWVKLQRDKQKNASHERQYLQQKKQAKKSTSQYKIWAQRNRGSSAVSMTHTAQHTGAQVYEQSKTNLHLIEIKSKLSDMYEIMADERSDSLKERNRKNKFYNNQKKGKK
jgi:hypothetical protein